MEKQFKFLGKKYDSLAKVTKAVETELDSMLAEWDTLMTIINDLSETYELAKKAELERDERLGLTETRGYKDPNNTFVTKIYDNLLAVIQKRMNKENVKQDNIIGNDDYEALLKDVGISVKKHKRTFTNLTKTVKKVTECEFSPFEMACAIKPEKVYVGFIIDTLVRQKEYNKKHFYENNNESESNM